jgi:hypothetical protein
VMFMYFLCILGFLNSTTYIIVMCVCVCVCVRARVHVRRVSSVFFNFLSSIISAS